MSELPSKHIDLSAKGLEVISPKFQAASLARRVRFQLRHQLESAGKSKSEIDKLLELRRLHHGRFK